MSTKDVKKVWIQLKRLDQDEVESNACSQVTCIEVHEDEGIQEIKHKFIETFNIPHSNLVFKLRNHRQSLIPIKGSIPNNSRNVPYVLEVLNVHQNITPKPRCIKLATYEQTFEKKLQDLICRVDGLESGLPELNQKRIERIKQEMNELEKKLGFLTKRLHEADNTQWKGMFKKNPMW